MNKQTVIAALERLKDGTKGVVAATISDCQKVIGEMEDIGWIPVTERMPESDGFYIVVMNGDIWGEPDVWSSTACGFYNGKWDEDDATISHWMPMPEPPMEVWNL